MRSHFSIQDAIDQLNAGNLDGAEQMFSAIATQKPDNWYAWFYLASAVTQKGLHTQALAYLYRAASLNPDESAIWNNLGTVLRRENHNLHAKEAFLKGAKLSPKDADLWSNLCTLCVNEGNPHDGLEYVNKALLNDPDHVNAKWNKALLLLETGQLAEGFDLYPAGMNTGERPNRWRSWPDYDPKEHKGKRVLVYGEQGLGDEVMYFSLLPDLIRDCGHVILECHPRLEALANLSFPDITVYPTRKDQVVEWEDSFDAKASLGDIPRHYRRRPGDFPRTAYLKTDPSIVFDYRQRLMERAGPGPYLGIGWKGGYKKTRKDLRSVPLDDLLPAIKAAHDAGGKIISFQYTDGVDAEVRQFEQDHGIKIHHWADIIQGDYMKTACLLECMDLAITVNTSLVHLAGAIGKELWTMTPKGCAWRYWSWDEHMMWYKSVTQYRAGENKTWGPVIKRITHDLSVKFSLLGGCQ